MTVQSVHDSRYFKVHTPIYVVGAIKNMRVCPKCGYKDSLYWRHSRYDFNADYCRKEEFAEIEPLLDKALSDTEPLVDGEDVYYRRGTGKIWVYRVYLPDFKVNCDRAYTKPKKLVEK